MTAVRKGQQMRWDLFLEMPRRLRRTEAAAIREAGQDIALGRVVDLWRDARRWSKMPCPLGPLIGIVERL